MGNRRVWHDICYMFRKNKKMKKVLFILLVATSCNFVPQTQEPVKETITFKTVQFALQKVLNNGYESKVYYCTEPVLGTLTIALYDKCPDNQVETVNDFYIVEKTLTLCGFFTDRFSGDVGYFSGAEYEDVGGFSICNCFVLEEGDKVYLYDMALIVVPKAAYEKAKNLVAQEEKESEARYNQIYNSI